MLTLLKMTFRPLSFNESVEVEVNRNQVLALDETGQELSASVRIDEDQLTFEIIKNERDHDDLLVLVSIELILIHQRQIKKIVTINHH